MFVNAVILSCKEEVLTLKSLAPYSYIKPLVVRAKGMGYARNLGVSMANSELVLMFDDDLIFDNRLLNLMLNVPFGSFIIAHNGEHFSTRVFAIHKIDYYRVGGFDVKINFIFEDGDFVLRAQKAGLKLLVVPSSLYRHVEHTRERYKSPLAVFRLNFEYCKVLVKYKREVFSNLCDFYWHPVDYKIKLADLVSKIIFTIYWLIISIRGKKL